LDRRRFNHICSGMLASAMLGSQAAPAADSQSYNRSRLHRDNQTPLTGTELEPGKAYVFFYPYVTTPAFLIDVAQTAVDGVGPNQSIVAFSAICTHKMSHPAREISFLNYRHDEVEFYASSGQAEKRSAVISCCSERSVYDARKGASVLGGPAPMPLARIDLEYNSGDDQLIATGSSGANMYERFFEKFGFRAALEHQVADVKAPSADIAVAIPAEQYSSQTIRC